MSSSSLRICFNSDCNEGKLERPRKGWCLRSGEYAVLCNRCSLAFKEGRFCETFHSNASGWRCCESCGKRVHCGCVVSAHGYLLLDAGGIECIPCAKKNVILTPNSVWPAFLFNPVPLTERPKDFSVKNWGQTGGSGPIGLLQQPPNFTNASTQSESHPRVPYGIDVSSGIERLVVSERSSASLLEKKKINDLSERSMNGSLKFGVSEMLENANAGISFEEQHSFRSNNPQLTPFSMDGPNTRHFGLAIPFEWPNGTNGQTKRSNTHSQRPIPSPHLVKQFHGNSHSGFEASNENHTNNGRPRGDARGRNYLLYQYLPKITDEELHKISGDSNAVITPLFEKTLSASDAGRIGRLVLPKKCAEAYFPPITQHEGLPIKVQDLQGQEWQFQFRFWPNNNSRMYVLEGVTPCIQSMKLQAGDTVTFSRLEPEGKLVMGCRKASTLSVYQGNQSVETGNEAPTCGDVNSADPASTMSKVDVSGCIAKEALGTKSSFPRKRKSSNLGSKSRRPRIDSEEIELKLRWEEAQGLLRPPCNRVPSVIMIEGFEFEEYEDAPILGRPTIFAGNDVGDGVQWAQCEDCLKWRRIPVDALLPSKWTCSDNLWDAERSRCSEAQEMTIEQLEDMLSTSIPAASKKLEAAKQKPDIIEPLEGLDALANIAILGEGEALPLSAQATTKHRRHRPGCSCIVCIQPPSGKGPKHKQTCTCNVCLAIKHRFHILMLHREKKLSEKEADSACKKQQEELSLPENVLDDDFVICNAGNSSRDQKLVVNEGSEEEPNTIMSSTSPFKGQIDLNIQPDREEELSPSLDYSNMMRMLQDATERHHRQQTLLSSNSNKNSVTDETHLGGSGGGGEELRNGITLEESDQDVVGHTKALVSMLATG